MTNHPKRPEDILPDGVDNIHLNGKVLRKGTIAAFLANVNILENQAATETEKQGALQMMNELAPAVIALGLHNKVIFKNPTVEQILVDTQNQLP